MLNQPQIRMSVSFTLANTPIHPHYLLIFHSNLVFKTFQPIPPVKYSWGLDFWALELGFSFHLAWGFILGRLTLRTNTIAGLSCSTSPKTFVRVYYFNYYRMTLMLLEFTSCAFIPGLFAFYRKFWGCSYSWLIISDFRISLWAFKYISRFSFTCISTHVERLNGRI